MYLILHYLTLIFLSASPHSFQNSGQFLTYQDTVYLLVESNEKIIEYSVKKGQTLFSISRYFGMHPSDLRHYNPGLGENIGVGQTIRIPVPNKAIVRYLPQGSSRKQFAPMVYRVKKGDTVFRIGQFFKMPLDTIRNRANLKNQTLAPGMIIPVGWISVRGIPDSFRTEKVSDSSSENQSLKERFTAAGKTKKIYYDQGPAFWLKGTAAAGKSFYALSNEAPLHSVVEVYNPMSQSKIYAEVLGVIPPSVYNKNIRIVLSAAAAKMLGARDPQFFVKLKYHK